MYRVLHFAQCFIKHTLKKKPVQGVDSVKQETAGKDVSLVLGTWDQQGSWHVSLEGYLTECVA